MDWNWMQILPAGTIAAILTAAVTWYIGRGTNKNKAEEVEAEKVKATLAGNFELTKYVREQITLEVAAATQGLRDELTAVRTEMRQLIKRERDTKDIIRRWFHRLTWWDEKGRIGPMPMPAEADMQLLDISDIEITAPTAAVRALRRPYVPPIPGKETE